jgi:hypothetical protein
MNASTAAAPDRSQAAQDPQKLDRLSPDALVEVFSRSQMTRWFLAALVVHAIVIGGFSIGTIRDLLDPEGAAGRKAEAARKAAPPAAAAQADAAPAAGQQPAPSPAAEPAASTGTTPIERATSEVAKPDEIPRTPDDLGIGLEDTNPN